MKITRFFAVFLSIAMVFAILPFSAVSASSAVWDGVVASAFGAGSGTEEDPYIITTAEELAYLSVIDTDGKYFELMNDIVLNDTSADNWTENATQWVNIDNFKGNFDGNGFEISGIYINPDVIDENACNYGLFGKTENAVIKNVNVTNTYIAGNRNLGGIVGYGIDTAITDCSFDGTVKACCFEEVYEGVTYYNGGDSAGGIVGYITSDAGSSYVANCFNSGEIYTERYMAGGIVGDAYDNVSIYNCENEGAVSGYSSVAGIVGEFWGTYSAELSVVEGCINRGSVTPVFSESQYIGGVIGYVINGDIRECVNYGKIGPEDQLCGEAVGGVIGFASTVNKIQSCVNYGDVTGLFYFGGVVGYAVGYVDSEGEKCYTIANMLVNHGDVYTVDYIEDASPLPSDSNAGKVAGVIGYLEYGEFSFLYNYGNVGGYDYVGGIVGLLMSGYVESAYNNGKVKGRNGVGGIVGENFILNQGDIKIANVLNKGEVYGHNAVGGIVGESYDYRYDYGQMTGLDVYSCGIRISKAQNNGNVFGYTSAGGIIGGAGYSIIEDIANLGKVTVYEDDGYGYSWCGGLIGYVFYVSDIVMNNGFSAGAIEYFEKADVGGVIGLINSQGSSITSGVYYTDPSLSGVGRSKDNIETSGIFLVSEEQIAKAETYETFDFENVWVIKDGCPQIQNLPESILGNINGDDVVDKKDYAIVKRACFGTAELDFAQFVASDANGDGIVDKKDYALIKRSCFGTAEIK